jgi:hypothetical protein
LGWGNVQLRPSAVNQLPAAQTGCDNLSRR